MKGPPCPVHPDVELRRETYETGFCLQCLKHYKLCTEVRYMSMCFLLKGHDGHHTSEHEGSWIHIGGVPVAVRLEGTLP